VRFAAPRGSNSETRPLAARRSPGNEEGVIWIPPFSSYSATEEVMNGAGLSSTESVRDRLNQPVYQTGSTLMRLLEECAHAVESALGASFE